MIEPLSAHSALVMMQAERDALLPYRDGLARRIDFLLYATDRPFDEALRFQQMLDTVNGEIADAERAIMHYLLPALQELASQDWSISNG